MFLEGLESFGEGVESGGGRGRSWGFKCRVCEFRSLNGGAERVECILINGPHSQKFSVRRLYLTQATEQLLNDNASDAHLFQNTYAQIAQLTYNEEDSLANRVGPLSQAQVYQLRSQILAYKHLVRNVPVPTSLLVPVVHANIWNSEKEKLAQKAVAFYR